MNTEKLNLKNLKSAELIEINGGGILAVAVAIVGTALAVALGKGYYDGKRDCMPPPCK